MKTQWTLQMYYKKKLFCLILQIKSRSARGASHHLAFMGNCPIISHTFLALSIQWISSPPSRKWKRGVSPKFHHIVLCLVWIKRTRRQGEFKILLCNPSGGNLRHSCINNPVKHQWRSSPVKTANGLNPYQSLLGPQLK